MYGDQFKTSIDLRHIPETESYQRDFVDLAFDARPPFLRVGPSRLLLLPNDRDLKPENLYKILRREISDSNSLLYLHFRTAKALMNQGRLDQALVHFNQVIGKAPASPSYPTIDVVDAVFHAAQIHDKRGEPDDAWKLLNDIEPSLGYVAGVERGAVLTGEIFLLKGQLAPQVKDTSADQFQLLRIGTEVLNDVPSYYSSRVVEAAIGCSTFERITGNFDQAVKHAKLAVHYCASRGEMESACQALPFLLQAHLLNGDIDGFDSANAEFAKSTDGVADFRCLEVEEQSPLDNSEEIRFVPVEAFFMMALREWLGKRRSSAFFYLNVGIDIDETDRALKVDIVNDMAAEFKKRGRIGESNYLLSILEHIPESGDQARPSLN